MKNQLIILLSYLFILFVAFWATFSNYIIVHFLIIDPRYRTLSYETDAIKAAVLKKLEELMEEKYAEKSAKEENIVSKQSDAMNYLFCSDSSLSEDEDNATEELQNYINEKDVSLSINPLQWWRDNEKRFPIISQIARKILCIPATSIPSERVFSTAGNIVTSKRSCLSSRNVNMLIFLSQNASYLEK